MDKKTIEYGLLPFDAQQLKEITGLDHTQCVYVNIETNSRAYSALCRYLIVDDEGAAAVEALKKKTDKDKLREEARKGVRSLRSVELSQVNAIADPFQEEDEDGQQKKLPKYIASLGLGMFETSFYDRRVIILHQTCGEPVGTGCDVDLMRTLVLLTPIKEGGALGEEAAARKLLVQLCSDAQEWDEQSTEHTYRIYQWSHDDQYWRNMATRPVRPLDSVILPQVMKSRLMHDIDSFSSREARRWYYNHGISYKRSYLFTGPPGVGKSSFLRVLAGHLKRNLALLHPVDPRMTDNAILTCMQQSPDNSIVVLEDIDALFDKKRKSKLEGACPLTFSGLLNALDGVGNKDGQIFVLTTNHPERLDPALIRPGRVDLRVDFPAATLEQVEGLFVHFYPGEEALAKRFVAEVEKKAAQSKVQREAAIKEYEKRKREREAEAKKRIMSEDKAKEGEDKASEDTDKKNVESEADDNSDDELEFEPPAPYTGLSMAALQQLFIMCRLATASECVERVAEFEGI